MRHFGAYSTNLAFLARLHLLVPLSLRRQCSAKEQTIPLKIYTFSCFCLNIHSDKSTKISLYKRIYFKICSVIIAAVGPSFARVLLGREDNSASGSPRSTFVLPILPLSFFPFRQLSCSWREKRI